MQDFDEDNIRLSKKERLILINQYRILEKLHPKEAHCYQKLMTILQEGYERQYHKLFDSLNDPISEDLHDEVMTILDMFGCLSDSYDALQDKSGLEEWKVRFGGFCGNTEASYLKYARYLVEQADTFSYVVKDKKYNSHAPSLWRYRPMVERWQGAGSPRRMTKETILKNLGDSKEG